MTTTSNARPHLSLKFTCPHCGIHTTKGVLVQYHNDKCKVLTGVTVKRPPGVSYEMRRILTMLKTYPPEQINRANLIDGLRQQLNLSSDAELAKALGMATSAITGIRNNKIQVDAEMLVRMWEVSRLSLRELRKLMA